MDKLIIGGRVIDITTAIEKYKLSKSPVDIKERFKAIFEYKLGINDGVIKTYLETGLRFSISSTRVRQICARVLSEIGAFPVDC